MFMVVPSEARRTWYSGPSYAAYSARTVLCAATHGVPPAAYMSHGSGVAECAVPGAPTAAASAASSTASAAATRTSTDWRRGRDRARRGQRAPSRNADSILDLAL